MDVVVWALWIWIACSIVALVVYVMRRVRFNRNRRSAIISDAKLTSSEPLLKPTLKLSANPNDSASADPSADAPSASDDSPSLVPTSSKDSDEHKPAEKLKPIKYVPVSDPLLPPADQELSDGSLHARADDDVPVPVEASAAAPVAEAQTLEQQTLGDQTLGDQALQAPAVQTHSPETTDASDVDLNRLESASNGAGATDAPAMSVAGTDSEPQPATEPLLADLLAGVRLPCELLPVDTISGDTDADADPDVADRAVTLVTMTAPPDVVGVALADELERLGYEIFSLSDSEAVAKRGESDVLSLAIRTNIGPNGEQLGEPADVAANEGLPSAVAVDMWVGGEASPLQRGASLEA